jgi:S1-C subfamily serine protease/rhodanese-related sulfurtransferase
MRISRRGLIVAVAVCGVLVIAVLSGILGRRLPGSSAVHRVAVPEMLLRVKPAVVLVVAEVSAEVRLDCGEGETSVMSPPFRESGSGWIIDAAGFVVTNAHVVQPAHSPPADLLTTLPRKAAEAACLPKALALKGLAPGARPDIEEELRRRILSTVAPKARVGRTESTVHVLLSDGMRHRAELKKYSPPAAGDAMSGRDLALLKIPAGDLPVLAVGAAKRGVSIGDRLHIFGFPGAVSNHELLSESTRVEATVTNGTVSGFKKDVAEHPVIQTDAPASWGNSGGPAVDDSGALAGVLTFVTVASGSKTEIVQGFNFVIPADTVRDFLRDTGVTLDARSRFNDVWWPALSAFFAGDYRAAIRQLEKTAALRPDAPDVQRLLAEARTRPRGLPWTWIFAAVITAGIAFGLALWVRGSRRARLVISVPEAISLLESPTPPALLDARDESVYAQSPVRIPKAIRVGPDGRPAPARPRASAPPPLTIAYATYHDAHATAHLARQLRRRGYGKVRILDGGLEAWVAAGLPVEANESMGGEAPPKASQAI